ncbi:MAG: prephenate dehydrogenase [Halanaerobiaceae bacterium]
MKVGIAGLGLMGTSLALALKDNNSNLSILGRDLNHKHLKYTLKAGIIDGELKSGADQLDFFFAAVPVRSIPEVIGDCISFFSPGETVISDLGSTKTWVKREIEARFPELNYIGGHPITGKEVSGPQVAEKNLFRGKQYVLTPPGGDMSAGEHFDRLRRLVATTGCQITVVTPEEHDRLLAITSHLPQVAASMLVNYLAGVEDNLPGVDRFIGSGFRDTTRIAASNTGMWLDIFATNTDNITSAIDGLISELRDLQQLVVTGDEQGQKDMLERSRNRRLTLQKVGDNEAEGSTG